MCLRQIYSIRLFKISQPKAVGKIGSRKLDILESNKCIEISTIIGRKRNRSIGNLGMNSSVLGADRDREFEIYTAFFEGDTYLNKNLFTDDQQFFWTFST